MIHLADLRAEPSNARGTKGYSITLLLPYLCALHMYRRDWLEKARICTRDYYIIQAAEARWWISAKLHVWYIPKTENSRILALRPAYFQAYMTNIAASGIDVDLIVVRGLELSSEGASGNASVLLNKGIYIRMCQGWEFSRRFHFATNNLILLTHQSLRGKRWRVFSTPTCVHLRTLVAKLQNRSTIQCQKKKAIKWLFAVHGGCS